jgi:DNA-binding XRE family transcriptional regulator
MDTEQKHRLNKTPGVINLLLKNQLDLAALVRNQRLQAGPKGGKMTADTLAELAGVSRDTIFRIERGEDVSFSTAMACFGCLALGLAQHPCNGLP